ncbi:hypothetical protein FHW89_004626 [Mucilaginibacter sp. SG564]|nr:hypothetical protein [Mucilaginibacter sp. SG564]
MGKVKQNALNSNPEPLINGSGLYIAMKVIMFATQSYRYRIEKNYPISADILFHYRLDITFQVGSAVSSKSSKRHST